MTTPVRLGGRPHGPVRSALERALREGISGHWDTLARHAGVDPLQARRTLDKMRRTGMVCAHQPADDGAQVRDGPGRPRVIYAYAALSGFNSFEFARQVWR